MQGKSIYKVPGGKLIKITLDYDETINSVTINGDFFLHPEDGIEKIEQNLSGVSLDTDAIIEKIDQAVKDNDITLFGIDSESLAKSIMIAGGKE